MAVEWTEEVVAVCSIVTLVCGVAVYHHNRIERVRRDLDEKIEKETDRASADLDAHISRDDAVHRELHTKVNETRENWAKNEDVRHLEARLDLMTDRLEKAFNAGCENVHKRIDSLQRTMTDVITKLANGRG